ncbi:cysteine-rich KTR domain-containing protein [uncultured Oscillibacter sp.]|uniref:cysteine-rich KTR domain-containing protein n=1 Tax=uncultured Oscillibacter sp. TaxID=876091 RepID=UPI003416AA60
MIMNDRALASSVLVDIAEPTEWIRCPICGNKTRNKVRKDTELKNFPLFCPKCRQENLINFSFPLITIISARR